MKRRSVEGNIGGERITETQRAKTEKRYWRGGKKTCRKRMAAKTNRFKSKENKDGSELETQVSF